MARSKRGKWEIDLPDPFPRTNSIDPLSQFGDFSATQRKSPRFARASKSVLGAIGSPNEGLERDSRRRLMMSWKSKLTACAAVLSLGATSAFASHTRSVNCDEGQSITNALAKLDKGSPATVTIAGTCTEYVLVDGFNDLTLIGLKGATLQQPTTNPPPSPANVLSIKASRSVTVLLSAPCLGLPSLRASELAVVVTESCSKT
jgi:hypothetical protein